MNRSLPATLGTIAGAVLSAALGSARVLTQEGWPFNHEYVSTFERVESFRRAFAAGDLYPLWSPFCFNGHGTPTPFFYHRLFNTVAAAVAWGVGTVPGVRIATFLFLSLGALGMVRAARTLGLSRPLALAGAALLMFAPYTLTGWLVRGAAAEHAGAMLVPWVLAAAIRWIAGRPAWPLALWMICLFYAHTVLFAFSLPAVGLAAALALRTRGRRWGADVGGAAALGAVALGPTALGIVLLRPAFNLSALHAYLPQEQYIHWRRYFWDAEFQWGGQWQSYSVELGRGLWLGLLLGCLAGAVLVRRRPRPEVLFLVVSGALYWLLQIPLSRALYLNLPGAAFLQFPWRLLSFLTPLVLLAMLLSWSAVWTAAPRSAPFGGALLGGLVVFQGLFALRAQAVRYPRFSEAHLHEVVEHLDGPFSGGEFLPQGARGSPPPSPFLSVAHGALQSVSPAQARSGAVHLTRLTLDVDCRPGCRVSSSQFLTPFLAVEPASRARASSEGTVVLDLPPGRHRVTLRQRGLVELAWRRMSGLAN